MTRPILRLQRFQNPIPSRRPDRRPRHPYKDQVIRVGARVLRRVALPALLLVFAYHLRLPAGGSRRFVRAPETAHYIHHLVGGRLRSGPRSR